MAAPLAKSYLMTLAAIALSWVVSDRALAHSDSALADSPAKINFAQAKSESSASRALPSVSPELPAPPPAIQTLLEPTFHAQAITPGLEETADPLLEDPLSDGFLTPEAVSPDLTSEEDLEDEVGEIRPLPAPAQSQTPPQPNGQLLLRSSAFTSSNVTGSSVTTVSDAVFVNGATLLLTPKLGPDTRLIATAGGGLTRFGTAGENSYNSLDFSVGVQQRFTETTYGQIGWVNNQLYSVATGERTLSDNSARLLIGRQDQLDQQLRLDTAYELRARFTDPGDRSRISNTFSTRLRYDFSPDWQSSLGYQLAFSEYTQNGRADTTHQVQLATTYTPTQDTFVTGFASYAFGRSSEATTDLSNLSFGVGVGLNLPLF